MALVTFAVVAKSFNPGIIPPGYTASEPSKNLSQAAAELFAFALTVLYSESLTTAASTVTPTLPSTKVRATLPLFVVFTSFTL